MNNSKEPGLPPAQGDFNEGDRIKSEVIPPETGENPHEKTRVPNKGWRLPRQEQTQRD